MEPFFIAHQAVVLDGHPVQVLAEPILQPASQVIFVADVSRPNMPLCRMETQDGGGFLLSARLTDVAAAFARLGVPACLMTAHQAHISRNAKPMLVMPAHFNKPEKTESGLICLPYKPHDIFQQLIDRELPFYAPHKNPLSLFVAATLHQVEYGIQRAHLRAHGIKARHKYAWQAAAPSPVHPKESAPSW
jgi:hypothetical protein